MGQIREDTTGFIFNLEVQIQQPTAQVGPIVSAKGLMEQAPQQGLSYSSPTADGDVEVRNQSGQVVQSSEQAPASAFQRQPQAAAPGAAPAQAAPAGARPAAPASRGAFGQAAPSGSLAPGGNRAQRRAAKKRKK